MFLQKLWRVDGLRLRLSLAGSYQLNTTNSLDYRFGNLAVATATLARPLTTSLQASLQAKLVHQGRNEYFGLGVPATGSTILYFTPGFRWGQPGGSVAFYGFLLLVSYSHVNEAQLAPRVAFLTGVSKGF